MSFSFAQRFPEIGAQLVNSRSEIPDSPMP